MLSSEMLVFNLDTTIAALLDAYPSAARVFIRRRMACVGCDMNRFETIADAARSYGIPPAELLADLRRSVPIPALVRRRRR
jgi:hybrid cluster-associated redox disulfide protein